MDAPLVSIVTPTCEREAFLRSLYSCVLSQDWPNIEWLISDDSAQPSPFFRRQRDARISYRHSLKVQTVGAKRNDLVHRAAGQYIAHFDDDDYYSPNYVSRMISFLTENSAELIKLSGFYIFDQRYQKFFYWNQDEDPGAQYVCWPGRPLRSRDATAKTRERAESHRLGYGFSYVYSRHVWETVKFPDVSFSEDLLFMTEAVKHHSFAFIQDSLGLCLHTIHLNNLSGCYPQYCLSNEIIQNKFPKIRTAAF